MKSTVLFAQVAVTALALVAAWGYQPGPTAFLKDSEVFVRMPGATEARQITSDGAPKGLLVQSNDGNRLAFVRESRAELADIVVMRIDGSGKREIHFRPAGTDVTGMRGVEDLQWISSSRLVASGSINPSTEEYAVIDVETGQQVTGYLTEGSAWAASPDGAHAAYVGFIPHFTQEESRRPQLCLDDECRLLGQTRGYPKEESDVHVEFSTDPLWSSDSSAVAIVAENYKTHDQSVIVRHLRGVTLDIPTPREAEGSLGLAWDGKALVLSGTNGNWRLEPGAAAFVQSK